MVEPTTTEANPGLMERFQVPGSWEFTPEVAEEFDDHVHASVPFYDDIQQLVSGLSDWLAPRGSVIADLGASTGTTAELIASRHPERKLTFHLYDSQTNMLNIAQRKLKGVDAIIHCHATSIENGLAHNGASMTLALFTLQFLDPVDRATVLRSARGRSRPHGALIVAEKLRLLDPRWQEIAISSSHDYKYAHGQNADAVHAKERSLRGVLNPLSDLEQRRLLNDCGWRGVETLFRWHQWVVYAAFASDISEGRPLGDHSETRRCCVDR